MDFISTSFGGGYVNFWDASFGDGLVSFSEASFGDGDVDFSNASFGKGDVNFVEASFGDGNVNFSDASFGGHVDFQLISSNGNLIFRNLKEPEKIRSFTMMGTAVDGLLSLSGNTFNCIPDLTETSIKHDVELQNLRVHLKRKSLGWKGLWSEKADDSGDIERLRKLKQIAENNKHHEAALRFHADEMKAKRWNKINGGGIGFFSSVLDLLYSAVCNYGQSIFRPITGLTLTWLVFLPIYWFMTKELAKQLNPLAIDWGELLVFTATNPLPFLPIAKTIREVVIDKYFEPSALLFATMSVQAIITLIFIFLIGLGIRNRFRI